MCPLRTFIPAKATVHLTARDTTDRLRALAPVPFEPLAQPDEMASSVMLDASRRFQTIVGFGAALTDASAETFFKLPKAKQTEFLAACFDPVKGLGYSIARTNIHSCDFSSDSYSYSNTPGDHALKDFSIEHDLEFRLPFIKLAIQAAGGNLPLYASPWSPPAWMKTNGDMKNGGKLKPDCRQAWADYYVRFLQAYRAQGLNIWGLSVQNEPMARQRWESCLYTAEEERDFVRDYLGPTLHTAGFADVKLMIWDHNRGLMHQRAQEVFNDPEASKYVWGTAFHWYPYPAESFDNVRKVAEAFPDKQLMFSEGCVEQFDPAKLDAWSHGERYGKNELLDLANGACGWTDWNILLDETGGPNHVGNFCFAPIHADLRTGSLTYCSSYYYLGHFSRFIRPGARRISCSTNDDGLLVVAFINPDQTIALVVLNLTDKPRDYKVWLAGSAAGAHSPAHSIATVVLNS